MNNPMNVVKKEKVTLTPAQTEAKNARWRNNKTKALHFSVAKERSTLTGLLAQIGTQQLKVMGMTALDWKLACESAEVNPINSVVQGIGNSVGLSELDQAHFHLKLQDAKIWQLQTELRAAQKQIEKLNAKVAAGSESKVSEDLKAKYRKMRDDAVTKAKEAEKEEKEQLKMKIYQLEGRLIKALQALKANQ